MLLLAQLCDVWRCPLCGAHEAFHPLHPDVCNVSPEEWRRMKREQRMLARYALGHLID